MRKPTITLVALFLAATVAVSCAAPTPAAPPTQAPIAAPAKTEAAPAKTESAPAKTQSAPAAVSSEEKWKKDYDAWEKETYQAAQREGKVVWMTSDKDQLTQALTEAFAKKYPGVKLEVLFGRGNDLGSRAITEQNAGKLVGDVISSGLSVVRPMIEQDRGLEFVPPIIREPGAGWLLDPMKEQASFPGKAVGVLQSLIPNALVINTKLVTPDKEPKMWQELGENPFWKGKVIARDPRQLGNGVKSFLFFKKWYGEEFWNKLVAQGTAYERSGEVMARAVATGEYHAAIAVALMDISALASAPIKFYAPAEGAFITEWSTLLLKGAPHPNAGKLFMNYILTKEAQDLLGMKGGQSPIRAGAKLESREMDLSNVKLLTTTMEEDLKELPPVMEAAKKLITAK